MPKRRGALEPSNTSFISSSDGLDRPKAVEGEAAAPGLTGGTEESFRECCCVVGQHEK